MRSAPWAMAALVVLLVALPPPAGALPVVHGALAGSGTAAAFAIHSYGAGQALEGGAADWNLVCSACFVRIAVTESSFTLVQNGEARVLVPGTYEIREFSGLVSHSHTGDGFSVVLAGIGQAETA